MEDQETRSCLYYGNIFIHKQATCGGIDQFIYFLNRAPDKAKVKPKMLYTSSKDALRKKLVGIATEVQATDFAEIDQEAVRERCLRK